MGETDKESADLWPETNAPKIVTPTGGNPRKASNRALMRGHTAYLERYAAGHFTKHADGGLKAGVASVAPSQKLAAEGLKYRPRAEVVIYGHTGVLAIKKNGYLLMPGGGIDMGERPEFGAYREAIEEADRKLLNLEDKGVCEAVWPEDHKLVEGFDGERSYFFIALDGGELGTKHEDNEKFDFIPFKEALDFIEGLLTDEKQKWAKPTNEMRRHCIIMAQDHVKNLDASPRKFAEDQDPDGSPVVPNTASSEQPTKTELAPEVKVEGDKEKLTVLTEGEGEQKTAGLPLAGIGKAINPLRGMPRPPAPLPTLHTNPAVPKPAAPAPVQPATPPGQATTAPMIPPRQTTVQMGSPKPAVPGSHWSQMTDEVRANLGAQELRQSHEALNALTAKQMQVKAPLAYGEQAHIQLPTGTTFDPSRRVMLPVNRLMEMPWFSAARTQLAAQTRRAREVASDAEHRSQAQHGAVQIGAGLGAAGTVGLAAQDVMQKQNSAEDSPCGETKTADAVSVLPRSEYMLFDHQGRILVAPDQNKRFRFPNQGKGKPAPYEPSLRYVPQTGVPETGAHGYDMSFHTGELDDTEAQGEQAFGGLDGANWMDPKQVLKQMYGSMGLKANSPYRELDRARSRVILRALKKRQAQAAKLQMAPAMPAAVQPIKVAAQIIQGPGSQKRKKPLVPSASVADKSLMGVGTGLALGGAASVGLGHAFLSDDDAQKLRDFADAGKRWNSGREDIRTPAREYAEYGHRAMTVKPFGVPLTQAMKSFRSSFLAPSAMQWNAGSQEHYDQFTEGPASGYIQRLKEFATAPATAKDPDNQYAAWMRNSVLKPWRVNANPSHDQVMHYIDPSMLPKNYKDNGLDSAHDVLMLDKNRQDFAKIRDEINDLGVAPMDVAKFNGQEFSTKLQHAMNANGASLGFKGNYHTWNPEQQTQALHNLNDFTRIHDPKLYAHLQLMSSGTGMNAQDLPNGAYNAAIGSGLFMRKMLTGMGAVAGVTGVGLLGYLMYKRMQDKKKQEAAPAPSLVARAA